MSLTYIKSENLANLHKYKYSGVDKSPIAKYILQPYWTHLVTLFPTTMAPNLITLLGFICIMLNTATLIYFSPDLKTPCPNWVYFTFAIGLFVYQSLDAIDGKQARRTGTSSPLGQLFDHGCDALNTTLGLILGANALNLGSNWMTILSLVSSIGNFYITTWEEFHTGTLYLGYFNGPTEGILTLVAVYVWTGINGPAWWLKSANKQFSLPVWFPQMKINELVVYSASGLLLAVYLTSMYNVYTACKEKKKSFASACIGLLPFLLLVGEIYGWLYGSPHIFKNHLVIFLLFICFAFGNMVGRMIVDHVVHQKFPMFNYNLLLLGIGAASSLTAKFGILKNPVFAKKEYEVYYLYFCFAASLLLHAHFVLTVINQICSYLDINCLTIKKKSTESNMKLRKKSK